MFTLSRYLEEKSRGSKSDIYTSVGQGNVFTGVCQEFCARWGGVVSQHAMDRGCLPGESAQGDVCLVVSITPPSSLGRHPLPLKQPLKRTVRILLKCILVWQIRIHSNGVIQGLNTQTIRIPANRCAVWKTGLKKLRREGLDLHRLLALVCYVNNTTVVAMQQCDIWWHNFATFDDIICMTCTFWILMTQR